jgi:hypothetical protein
MPAYDIEQLLINEANRIGPDIYRKTLNTSPWLKLVKKDTWPDEMGDTVRVLTYERSLPNTSLNWNQISINGVGASNGTYPNNTVVATGNSTANQLPSTSRIEFAQTLRSYNLTHTALESPKLSVNDLRFTTKRKEQLSNIFAILQENTSYAWQDRFRDEYVRLAQNKVNAVLGTDGRLVQNSGDGSVFSSVTRPTGVLTQGILDRVYMKLIRDGGGNNPLDRENSRPVFGVILSSESSRNLIMANTDIRNDYRWSTEKDSLLAPLGITRSYGGYFHMVDDWLPRHDAYATTAAATASATLTIASGSVATLRAGQQVSGTGIPLGTTVVSASGTSVVLSSAVTLASGAFVYFRRAPYTAVATTQGVKWDIDPLYESAEFEDSIVFHQDVFTNLVPKPLTAAGSNVQFDAVSYMGDFKWLNIQNATDNPDKTIGYFRAILSSGSKPIRPEWGTVIRHKRSSTPNVIDTTINA